MAISAAQGRLPADMTKRWKRPTPWAAIACNFSPEQQPVAGTPDHGRRGQPVPRRPGPRRPEPSPGPHFLSDQPGQPRRRAVEKIHRRHGEGVLPTGWASLTSSPIRAHTPPRASSPAWNALSRSDEIHCQTRSLQVGCLLETTAGQGTAIGWRFEHLAAILSARRPGPAGRLLRHLPRLCRRLPAGDPGRIRRQCRSSTASWAWGKSAPFISTTASASWVRGWTATPTSATGRLGWKVFGRRS